MNTGVDEQVLGSAYVRFDSVLFDESMECGGRYYAFKPSYDLDPEGLEASLRKQAKHGAMMCIGDKFIDKVTYHWRPINAGQPCFVEWTYNP